MHVIFQMLDEIAHDVVEIRMRIRISRHGESVFYAQKICFHSGACSPGINDGSPDIRFRIDAGYHHLRGIAAHELDAEFYAICGRARKRKTFIRVLAGNLFEMNGFAESHGVRHTAHATHGCDHRDVVLGA